MFYGKSYRKEGSSVQYEEGIRLRFKTLWRRGITLLWQWLQAFHLLEWQCLAHSPHRIGASTEELPEKRAGSLLLLLHCQAIGLTSCILWARHSEPAFSEVRQMLWFGYALFSVEIPCSLRCMAWSKTRMQTEELRCAQTPWGIYIKRPTNKIGDEIEYN